MSLPDPDTRVPPRRVPRTFIEPPRSHRSRSLTGSIVLQSGPELLLVLTDLRRHKARRCTSAINAISRKWRLSNHLSRGRLRTRLNGLSFRLPDLPNTTATLTGLMRILPRQEGSFQGRSGLRITDITVQNGTRDMSNGQMTTVTARFVTASQFPVTAEGLQDHHRRPHTT